MATKLGDLSYSVGKPGMIASHSYKHTRQHLTDPIFTHQQTGKFYFGTAAIATATGKLGDATAAGSYIGIFVDNDKFAGVDYYEKENLVTILTMGDIWVEVKPGITIVPFQKANFLTTADNGIPGKFTNEAVAAGIVAAPGVRFLSENVNGMALVGVSCW